MKRAKNVKLDITYNDIKNAEIKKAALIESGKVIHLISIVFK